MAFQRRIPKFLQGLVKTDEQVRDDDEAAAVVVSTLEDREDAADEAPMIVEDPAMEVKHKDVPEKPEAAVAVPGKRALKKARRVVVTEGGAEQEKEEAKAKKPAKKVALSFRDDD